MDPREFFSFFKRRGVILFIAVLVGVSIGLVHAMKNEGKTREALIFVTLGMEVDSGTPADFYVTNESANVVDQFTETVQGWLYNPALLERMNDVAGVALGVGVRKQEKQNLLVTVSFPSSVDSAMIPGAVLSVLNQEIATYNSMTHTRFVLALNSMTLSEPSSSRMVNSVVGGGLALFFAFLLLLLMEYATYRVSFAYHVEKLVGQAPAFELPSYFGVKCLSRMLESYRYRFSPETVWVDLGKTRMQHKAGWLLGEAEVTLIPYPEALGVLSAGTSFLAVIQLGKTCESEIRELKALVNGSFQYILIS
ncbi:MAG: hypothetical protein WCW30_01740 [Candidatus Gracilibacteria bacterium]